MCQILSLLISDDHNQPTPLSHTHNIAGMAPDIKENH